MNYGKGQCMSIKAKLLKRLDEAEKKIKPSDIDVIVFIEETEEAGTYSVQQNIYHGREGHRKDSVETWTVKATSAKEVADSYTPPEGCKEHLIFMRDFGE